MCFVFGRFCVIELCQFQVKVPHKFCWSSDFNRFKLDLKEHSIENQRCVFVCTLMITLWQKKKINEKELSHGITVVVTWSQYVQWTLLHDARQFKWNCTCASIVKRLFWIGSFVAVRWYLCDTRYQCTIFCNKNLVRRNQHQMRRRNSITWNILFRL